uniref:Large ribosomal subunit protein bL32c n=1 Tax=Phacus orbicularis TaxID=158829 RepID=A0A172F1N8_9EUGL|nr:ribosomal protein L32 [Phacus orbicularis]
MAVPKKKTSKSRRGFRRNTWIKKLSKQVSFALTIGNSLLKDNSSFIYITGLTQS